MNRSNLLPQLALLGEMTQLGGELVLNKNPSKIDGNGLMHCLSYAAQSPWLQHLSIKDNILFGSPLDEDRYEQVIDACALRADLDMLEDGDATEIGARGVSLSGGQKARYDTLRLSPRRTTAEYSLVLPSLARCTPERNMFFSTTR